MVGQATARTGVETNVKDALNQFEEPYDNCTER